MSNLVYLKDKFKTHIQLDVPFCHQRSDSACCGPCCLKMLVDYYGVGDNYSKESLIAMCKTSQEEGVSFRNLNKAVKAVGLKRERCDNMLDVTNAIDEEKPVLTIMPDFKEYGTDHYVLITGYHECDCALPIIFVSDSYYGEYAVMWLDLEEKIRKAGNWMWSISKENNND